MKKIVSLVLALSLAAMCAVSYAESPVYADVNGDGVFNLMDIRCLVEYIAAAEAGELSAEQFERADINKDGKINLTDMRAGVEKMASEQDQIVTTSTVPSTVKVLYNDFAKLPVRDILETYKETHSLQDKDVTMKINAMFDNAVICEFKYSGMVCAPGPCEYVIKGKDRDYTLYFDDWKYSNHPIAYHDGEISGVYGAYIKGWLTDSDLEILEKYVFRLSPRGIQYRGPESITTTTRRTTTSTTTVSGTGTTATTTYIPMPTVIPIY